MIDIVTSLPIKVQFKEVKGDIVLMEAAVVTYSGISTYRGLGKQLLWSGNAP